LALICIATLSTCIFNLHGAEVAWPENLFKFMQDSAEHRRLWPTGLPDLNKIKDDANKVIGDGGSAIKNPFEDLFQKIKQEMQKGQRFVNDGLANVQAAYDESIKLGKKMEDLSKAFEPLKKLFESSHGLVPLLTTKTHMQNLVSFLTDLLEDAGELAVVGDKVGGVAGLFDDLLNFFNGELAKLVNSGRRLVQFPPFPTPTLPDIDFTLLLADLNFQEYKTQFLGYKDEAQKVVTEVSNINATVYPLLMQMKNSLDGRRLVVAEIKDMVQEIRDNQAKYGGAVRGIIPAWRKGEDLTMHVCGAVSTAKNEVLQLKCRVDEFTRQVTAPATIPSLEKIKTDCFERTKQPPATCPTVQHSANVRDMLSQQSDVLGWTAAAFSYSIEHYKVLRITLATIILVVGLMMALFGYRYKDCEFWIEGFLAGIVVWSIVIAVMIVYFGMCRGQFIHTCEPKIMLIVVLILSTGCACLTVKLQAAQEFLAGFDLGAMAGGFAFLAFKHEEVFNTFINAEDSKPIMTQLMAASFVTGLVVGILTKYWTKLALIIGTSLIGSFGIIISVALYFPHYLDKPDIIAWGILTVFFSLVQYFGTSHTDDRYDRVYKSADEADETSSNM